MNAMDGNPYAEALDHRGDSSAIIRAQSAHTKAAPATDLDWAWWWYTTGELHGAAATFRHDGGGHGSAADCYHRAAQRFELAGDNARAEVCRELREGRLRLAARVP